MGRKNKAPSRREEPGGAKIARSDEALAATGDSEQIAWRFSRVDMGGKWGWKALDEVALDLVHGKFCSFETMTAAELFGRGGRKAIPVGNCCEAARKRLIEIDADDLDLLWELPIGGKPRVWGIRERHVFFPIWWDPDHTVCPSTLRNT